MRPDRNGTNIEFGTRLSRLGKRLLLAYGIIYVLELILEHWLRIPVFYALSLFPLNNEHFHLWQILTHPFLHDPSAPLGFAVTCIVFYFFSGPIENALGEKGFLILFYFSALGAMIFGLAMSMVPGFGTPFAGMGPSLLSLVVVFGLLNPEATILLMFVLPIKAKYLSYGTVIITLLTFLAKANPHGAYHLGGILFGYLYFRGPSRLPTFGSLRYRYDRWRMQRKKARFRVIDGSGGRDGKKGPTYH